MTVNAIEVADHHRPIGPFVLACGYCHWTSQEIGVQFDKVTHISGQLAKVFNKNLRETSGRLITIPEPAIDLSRPDNPEIIFSNLKTFLKSQLSNSHPDNPLLTPSGDVNYSSPSSLARIMSLYTNIPGYGRKSAQKSSIMRESVSLEEGLLLTSPTSDVDTINKLRREGYPNTTSPSQRSEQTHNLSNLTSDLRPVPMLLRTKRASRCRTCRHILAKPEAKVESTRYRIRLLALNYVPTINIKALHPASSSQYVLDLNNIPPLQTSQFLLSLRNPLFDPVSVTLATPNRTPGNWGHKVTILCPQFDIGANTDAWEEALDTSKATQPKDARSFKRFGDIKPEYVGQEGKVAEAGKVWERGRNWTSVVVEVGVVDVHADGGAVEEECGDEDEDVLEIPVFVRVEWEAEVEEKGKEGVKEKRELAYWVVLGVGRIGKAERTAKLGEAVPARR
ncbi:MAG: hypothetical protein LQ346_005545 [Caloplaca aetnensis]|nr:MAG: hypothetical protein LQ346_005545 [Caloplaca aetnensis]